MRTLEDKAFLLLLAGVSLAFAYIAWQFFGAILWGVVAAILFAPVYRQVLSAMGRRKNPAALETLTMVVLIVILPLAILIVALMEEASSAYGSIQSGQIT
jgi:predicted PurR-regulated permease PerM